MATLKEKIRSKLMSRGVKVSDPKTLVPLPLLLEVIELLELDTQIKVLVLMKEIQELRRTVSGLMILLTPEDLDSK